MKRPFIISLATCACLSASCFRKEDPRTFRGVILHEKDSTPFANTTFKLHNMRRFEAFNTPFTTDSNGAFSVVHDPNTGSLDYVCWPDGMADMNGDPYKCFKPIPALKLGDRGADVDLGTIYAPES